MSFGGKQRLYAGCRGGEVLAVLRQQQGMSQHRLARCSGKSRSMIAQMEAGTRWPSPENLRVLSDALSLSSDERALLFVSFEMLPPDLPTMLPAIAAVLQLDRALSLYQVEQLMAQVTGWYEAACSSRLL